MTKTVKSYFKCFSIFESLLIFSERHNESLEPTVRNEFKRILFWSLFGISVKTVETAFKWNNLLIFFWTSCHNVTCFWNSFSKIESNLFIFNILWHFIEHAKGRKMLLWEEYLDMIAIFQIVKQKKHFSRSAF